MCGSRQQRGAVTLIGALFIIITLLLMLEVLHTMAGSDILDSAVQNDSVEALFIAETGIEHAAYLYSAGTACADLATVDNTNTGRGSFDVTAAALVGTDCHIRVSGSIATLGAQRLVEAVLDKQGNLIANANPDFNDPDPCLDPIPPGCEPTGWTLDTWDETGGPDGSRAAYVEKLTNGPMEATSAGSFGLTPFTVTAPVNLTLSFDYKVETTGGSGKEGQLFFELEDGSNTYPASPYPFESGDSGGYVFGSSVTIGIGGTGPVTITDLKFRLFAKSGKPKKIWLDNLVLQGPGGGSSVALRQWREIVSN